MSRPRAGWLRTEVAAGASELRAASAGFSRTSPGAGSEGSQIAIRRKETRGWKFNVCTRGPQLSPAPSACITLTS